MTRALLLLCALLMTWDTSHAQPVPPAEIPELAPFNDRLVSEIRYEGLEQTAERFVENQLRTTEGRPFQARAVTQDIQRLYRTGRFYRVNARVEPAAGGSVAVIYEFEEAPIIQDVEVVGNRNVTRGELAGVVDFLRGTPVDEFRLGQTQRAIEELYRQKGYYQARVAIDEKELEQGVILFRIREGQRIKVTQIRFEGNESFAPREIRTGLETKTAGIFKQGPLDEEALERDIVSIVNFYRDRGHLDVRADREITASPDGREAIVTFVIEEGPRYTLRDVTVEYAPGGLQEGEQGAISTEQAKGLMELKPGDVYGAARLRQSLRSIQEALYQLGHVDAQVRSQELRAVDEPSVDLIVRIFQGERFLTGEVVIQGNRITRQKVIRREIDVRPGLPLDRGSLQQSESALQATRLFRQPGPGAPEPGVRISILPEDPATPGMRDVLVEVEETSTGSINFGAAVNSDSGLIGTLSVRQDNFDLFDVPASPGEILSGEAFRGAGQRFQITLAPGIDVQTYSISLTEPHLFATDYSLGGAAFFREREFDEFDEERLGGNLRVGRRFGERWSGGLSFRVNRVELSDIDPSAAVDIFEAEGPDLLFGVGLDLTRTTVPRGERFLPSRGTRTELRLEQVFGDFDFTKLEADHTIWLTLREDFLGRKTILKLNTAAGLIPQEDEAPIYERFFLGGRSFRGFDFRGVSPRGIRADTGELGDDPVGGRWSFFLGAELQQPIWGNVQGRPVVSVVGFVDSGTVTNDIGFDDYRVSVGVGLRLLLPISPIPLALDFGFPVVSEDDDEEEIFSFSIDLPF